MRRPHVTAVMVPGPGCWFPGPAGSKGPAGPSPRLESSPLTRPILSRVDDHPPGDRVDPSRPRLIACQAAPPPAVPQAGQSYPSAVPVPLPSDLALHPGRPSTLTRPAATVREPPSSAINPATSRPSEHRAGTWTSPWLPFSCAHAPLRFGGPETADGRSRTGDRLPRFSMTTEASRRPVAGDETTQHRSLMPVGRRASHFLNQSTITFRRKYAGSRKSSTKK
jgi:hypothetical protein